MAETIRRARTYDRAAFAAIYRRAVTPVYRYLAARLDAQADAEELTQEVFLAALDGIRNLRADDEDALLAWLFQIARHKLADRLRRRYRRPVTELEQAESLADPEEPPEASAEADEERAALRGALSRLTPEQREVIICKYVLEYDNERTARVLGKTANAINQLHHRALASLQRLLTRPERAG
ncbi:MAG: RNA polymerase sigma factor [Chloroflexota bacterium]